MSHSVKRSISIFAIIVASVAAGMILTADLGWMRQSHAQTATQTTAPGTMMTVPSFADVAQRVMPAVVSITTTEVVKGSDMQNFHGGVDPFDFFFPDPRKNPRDQQDEEHKQMSGGSGFIISPDGYILTNNHVVENATKVEVRYGEDDNTVQAKIIGRDPSTDIALLKVDVNHPLPTVKLGDSDAIRVGDWVMAIGNPLQFSNTLTVGVVSAKGRSLGISEATQSFENFIQTDAAINFGNSGGPLLNINGEVIGINTAIRAYAQNIGFATPVNVAKRIYPELKDKGKVTRGYLGIRVTNVDQKTVAAFNLPTNKGAFVESIDVGTPGANAGLKPGDVIVQVDDKPVITTRDLIDYVSYQGPNKTVKLTIIRNGQRQTVNARTAERPEVAAEVQNDESSPAGPARNKLGMGVQELTPQTRQMYNIDAGASGLLVTDVKEVSASADAGITEGDIISEVNGEKITSVEQFRRIVDGARGGQYLRMYVTRPARGGRGQSFFAIVQVP